MIRNEELHYLHNLPTGTRRDIAHGISAWRRLRDETTALYDVDGQLPHKHKVQLEAKRKPNQGSLKCPFSSIDVSQFNGRPEGIPLSQGTKMLDEQDRDPDATSPYYGGSSSPAASAAESSRCPIRFLDQHSPEEVAEYFRNHSHELPRSHEICVKRYQRNEESIRQLDHKYGNLVNMIQGLGQKHQILLSTKAEGDSTAPERSSNGKVEKWASDVKSAPEALKNGTDVRHEVERREGHFDRPLKEVRVGESPSRPWGISVPQPTDIPPSVTSAREAVAEELSPQPEVAKPLSPLQEQCTTKKNITDKDAQRMLFTGPVFIGYSSEDAAKILHQSETGTGCHG